LSENTTTANADRRPQQHSQNYSYQLGPISCFHPWFLDIGSLNSMWA
jgi:hypothetical protein